LFKYQLELEDGTPADPPSFTTAVPTWHAGDKGLIRPGFELEIVAIHELPGDAQKTWIVRRL
jgi:hypothetical protein